MRSNFTLILLTFLSAVCQAQNATGSPEQQKENLLTQALSTRSSDPSSKGSWFEQARQEIREREYHINWEGDLKEYVAMNRKNQLGFFIQPDGYRVISFLPAETNKWEFGFKLKTIQRGNNSLQSAAVAKVIQDGNALTYRHSHFEIEYLNDSNGMRQNFIVNQRLNGKGLLEIVIQLEGELKAAIANNNGLVLSAMQNGEMKTKLIYDQLKVWDKNHQVLESEMEIKEDGKTLVISVDDALAAYPITVDPLNHVPDWTDTGLGVLPALDVLYGSTVSEAGDVNNDGFDDIIIGAPANLNVLSGTVIASTGQAFIYLGSPSGPSTTPDITLQSAVAVNALFGFCVSDAGDINGDGFDDVIVGAPGDVASLNFGIPFGTLSNDIGKAYVYYGNSNTAAIAGSVATLNLRASDFLAVSFGLAVNPLFGYSVSSAGDVNNDGFDDVIVGSPVYADLGTLTLGGRASIFLGSGSGLNTASPIHRNGGLLVNALFGYSVSSAGDMNNDGADEVLVGAPGALSLLPGLTGKAYVYSGIPSPATGGVSTSPITYSSGALLKTLFGFSVSNAGDVNSDGFDDIVVGQPATLSLSGLVNVGSASVFFGSNTLADKTVSDIVLRSPRDPDILGLLQGNLLFGFSVSGGKDLDCDGIDDIVVGEPGGTSLTGLTGINALGGQVYIFHGKNGTGPNSIPGWDLKETSSLAVANLLGYSVSMAGDINGDGKNDLLVGAANGTLDLSNLLSGLLDFVFVQAVGSAHAYYGCVTPSLFTLPVSLTQFNGYLQNNSVALFWKTASEENSSHFVIERSVNNMAFQSIGTVQAKGNGEGADYSFIDHSPEQVNNTYRLKMVDKDGKSTYSAVVLIKLEKKSFIRVKSTLVNTEFVLEFNKAAKGDYMVDIIAMDGRVVRRNQVNVSFDYITKTISMNASHSSGIYIVRVQNASTGEYYQERIRIH